MINKPTKKIFSKLICAIFVPLLLLINGGVASIAYAANVDGKCPDGWVFSGPAGSVDDGSLCKKDGVDSATAQCDTGGVNNDVIYHKLDSQSTNGIIICQKNVAITPSSDLAKNIKLLAGVQATLNKIIWPVLVMTGGLMQNDLLFGNGMEAKLQEVWIPIRNLVNILFVIILVGIALYNILGLGDEGGNTSIKSILPKIIIGIIAVNFSFTAIKVVLDGVNVITTEVFTLPGQVSGGLNDIVADDKASAAKIKKLCGTLDGYDPAITADLSDTNKQNQEELARYVTAAQEWGVTGGATVEEIKANAKADLSPTSLAKFNNDVTQAKNNALCDGPKLTPKGKAFLSSYNSRNAAFAMALNMGNIVFYDQVDPKSIVGTTGDKIEKIFVNGLFSMILYLIYVASFIVLFAVLLGRVVVMWLCIAVSPVLLLLMAAPSLKDKVGGLGKLTEVFTKNAIAPLLVSLSMTIGWIMLKAVQGTAGLTGSGLSINAGGIPVANFNTLQDFMVAIGVIAVVWVGVFAATEGTIAAVVTDKIRDGLKSAGTWVGQLPFKHIPAIPVNLPDHAHQNYTFSQLGHYMETLGREKEPDAIAKAFGQEKSGAPSELQEVHDSAGLRSHLKRATDLQAKPQREAVKKWLVEPANDTEIKRMRGNSKDPNEQQLLANLEKLAAADDDTAPEIAKTIRNNPLVTGASTADKAAKPGEKPAAAPAKDTKGKKGKEAEAPAADSHVVKPTPATEGQEIAGKKFSKDDVKTINEQTTKLDAAVTTKDTAQIKTQLGEVKKNFPGHFGEVALQQLVGKAEYDKIVAAVGDEDQLRAILNSPAETGADTDAHPPAAPGH